MNENVLLIRADGNSTIGMGHIMRTMTIAKAFVEVGFKCIYVCSSPVNNELFERNNISVIEVKFEYNYKSLEEARYLCKIAKSVKAKYIFVDSYFATNEYLTILRSVAKVIYISSMHKRFNTDYLINENIACNREEIEEMYTGSNTKLLLGSEYSPIRQEFCGHKYDVSKPVRKIMITTGGGDQHNFMTRFSRLVKRESSYQNVEFTFVSGVCNSNYESLVEETKNAYNVRILNNCVNMADVMLESDLAISAGGTTILELCVIGVPTIGISVAEDQLAGLKYMDELGIIEYAGNINDSTFWSNLDSILKGLFNDYSKRKMLSMNAQNCIDGQGAIRIRDIIFDN